MPNVRRQFDQWTKREGAERSVSNRRYAAIFVAIAALSIASWACAGTRSIERCPSASVHDPRVTPAPPPTAASNIGPFTWTRPLPDASEWADIAQDLAAPIERLGWLDHWGGTIYQQLLDAGKRDRVARPKDGRFRVFHASLAGRLVLREQLEQYSIQSLPSGVPHGTDMVEQGIRVLAWFATDESPEVVSETCAGLDLVLGARNANFVIASIQDAYEDDWKKTPACGEFLDRLNRLMDAGAPQIGPK